jgi:hypothetical protein
MQKFEFLRQPLLRRREEEKKMPFIVATYVYASNQGQRTHSALTKNKSASRARTELGTAHPQLVKHFIGMTIPSLKCFP